ncbi:MAG: hypothetical protein JF620_01105 [Mesorhizobium sp.]|nr:hypothetical protein [Mesorhizobium sp.]
MPLPTSVLPIPALASVFNPPLKGLKSTVSMGKPAPLAEISLQRFFYFSGAALSWAALRHMVVTRGRILT